MPHVFTTSALADARTLFAYYRSLGERAMAQVSDADLVRELDPGTNPIAVIVKHLAGNMRSRWTDFLTTDGEKPDRARDTEFEDPPRTRAEIVALWNAGWACVEGALAPLEEADLARTVTIRGEPHSVAQAILRQIGHYAYHVGQIVLLARHFAGERWMSLSIPRGRSEAFTRAVERGDASQR
jgi:Protein of unknown function (DUF1572)